MIELLWYRRSWLNWLFAPFAMLFALITSMRRYAYKKGILPSYRASAPVIVVGNITVGGNGKTPVVLWLVELLTKAGYKPGVVSRGYGGKAPHYPYMLTPLSTAAESGDEPLLIYQRCGCPVAVAPKRAEAVQLLLEQAGVDIIVCDDGLQHYALQRDIELVVMDGVRRLGNGWLMPMGPLRESASRMRNVLAVICNGGQARPDEIQMTLQPAPLCNVKTGRVAVVTGAVDAMAGIGHPPRFFNALLQQGYALNQQVAYADHQDFNAEELRQRFAKRPLIMTEKDAVKCRHFALDNWWYLPVTAQLPDGFAARLLAQLKELKHGAGL